VPVGLGGAPAMGYGDVQIAEPEDTIRATPCDVVVVGTPIDLTRVLKIDKPAVRVSYQLEKLQKGQLETDASKALAGAKVTI